MTDDKPNYIIVCEVGYTSLSSEVNRMIKEGYVPTGGLAVTVSDHGVVRLYQAMVTSFLVEDNGVVFHTGSPEVYEN